MRYGRDSVNVGVKLKKKAEEGRKNEDEGTIIVPS
jgi:hypothetical protein